MGNFISCTLAGAHGNNSNSVKVVFPNGEISQFDAPINAAELMFDMPSHFLVNTRSMEIGRRFSALSADEDLEMGNVYVMFPMKRVNSVIAAADMDVYMLWMTSANSAVSRSSGGKSRVLPETTGEASSSFGRIRPEREVQRLVSLDEMEDSSSVCEFKFRMSMCRSRKPMLETITEEAVSSR